MFIFQKQLNFKWRENSKVIKSIFLFRLVNVFTKYLASRYRFFFALYKMKGRSVVSSRLSCQPMISCHDLVLRYNANRNVVLVVRLLPCFDYFEKAIIVAFGRLLCPVIKISKNPSIREVA